MMAPETDLERAARLYACRVSAEKLLQQAMRQAAEGGLRKTANAISSVLPVLARELVEHPLKPLA